MPTGYDDEPDYGGQPPFDPNRIWPVLSAMLLAVFVWLMLRTFL